MTERLTIDGLCGSEECDGYCNPCDYQGKILKKLSHYEDLEEQGRLVVLPEKFDRKKLFAMLSDAGFCPSEYSLGPIICSGNCKECWEKALKGE